jgi:hypothetical protein
MTGSLSTCCLIRKVPSPKGAAERCARPANNATPYYKLICTIVTTESGYLWGQPWALRITSEFRHGYEAHARQWIPGSVRKF